jgi:transposase
MGFPVICRREELHACMEATSLYYEKLATFLHVRGSESTL